MRMAFWRAKTKKASEITEGRFPVARLPAVEDEKILKGTDGDMEEVDMPNAATRAWLLTQLAIDGIVAAPLATVGDFQTNPATGDGTNPENINDNNTGTKWQALAVNNAAEVDFGKAVVIRRWRHFGSAASNADGSWKIEYYDLGTSTWEDWVTGIATRVATWTGLATETEKITTKIRLVCTGLDSGFSLPDRSECGELEVYY